MKTLSVFDIVSEDSLLLDFRGELNVQVALEEELGPFFQALERHAHGWMPDVVGGKHKRKYTRDSISKALSEARHEGGTTIGLYRTKWPAIDMTLRLRFPPLRPELDLTLKIKPLSFLSDEGQCRQFIDMVRTWASRYTVSHAFAHSLADDHLAGAPNYGRSDEAQRRDGFDKVYEISWLNVLGPKLVETIGRQRILSTPAHRVEELPNGSILLALWSTAADFASETSRLVQARAHVHLRPELDHDTVLRALYERSAALAPVKPLFHPDVAPLLERIVDDVPIHERQRKIAELNAWQPPEPDEWRPVTAPLPPDVPDEKRTCEHYDNLAEHLVALLHSTQPSLFEATPGSLMDVDYQFWHEDFPTTFEWELIQARAVPAVGAYLGKLLVRHLGGQWIPRRRLEESQVRVGTRLWLPFLRARHYLRSRQSLLDFSLTQLYRVAERHRS